MVSDNLQHLPVDLSGRDLEDVFCAFHTFDDITPKVLLEDVGNILVKFGDEALVALFNFQRFDQSDCRYGISVP